MEEYDIIGIYMTADTRIFAAKSWAERTECHRALNGIWGRNVVAIFILWIYDGRLIKVSHTHDAMMWKCERTKQTAVSSMWTNGSVSVQVSRQPKKSVTQNV